MKKTALLLLLFLAPRIFALNGSIGASLFVAPISALVEQVVSGSLVISQVNGSSVVSTYIQDFMPQVWVTNTGSSVTSYAVSKPSFGSSLAGQNPQFGGTLTLPMSWRFHAPSMYPSYGSSVQVGTQTYTLGAQITMSNGTIVYPTTTTITVSPLTLPSSQVTGWHN